MPAAQPACPGFKFAGIIAGIKASGRADLGLIVAEDDVPAAAVFTQNRVRAAPVELSEANVKSGLARAIIVNSGNANACTGDKGAFDAAAMAEYAARAIGCDKKRVLVASTGIIGQPLPIERIVAATPRLHAAARGDGLDDFARAIMTTDRFEKRALQLVPLGPKTRARVIGVAKGAGMIAPNMATTLAFLCTDAAVSKGFLRTILREEIASTFNAVSVDGDTSTNDMVAIMASGAAKNKPIDSDAANGGKGKALRQAVHDVLDELSRQIVRDGEGATHVVTIEVAGAESAAAADAVARRIAQSPLCKAAFFGADPNWGRILAAIGNAGVDVDARKLDVAIGEVEICRGGLGLGAEAERHAHEVMRRGEYTIRVHLNRGRAQGRHTTCDLTVDYVKLNADYRT
jgi:glutamate N-acetyltransferase / amino-acid N-acetyltransferase